MSVRLRETTVRVTDRRVTVIVTKPNVYWQPSLDELKLDVLS